MIDQTQDCGLQFHLDITCDSKQRPLLLCGGLTNDISTVSQAQAGSHKAKKSHAIKEALVALRKVVPGAITYGPPP